MKDHFEFSPRLNHHLKVECTITQKELNWKEVFGRGPDGLHKLVQQIVQEVREGDMEEAVEAQKSERTADRVGYRSEPGIKRVLPVRMRDGREAALLG